MKTYKNLYYQIYEWGNLLLAWRKARNGKTKRPDVKRFEEDLVENLQQLQFELMIFAYVPLQLTSFPIRDPKTRIISKSDFRDRIIHHALINVIQDIFEKSFIYDSCANQKGKGNLFAIKRFNKFLKKVSVSKRQNGWFNQEQVRGYCLKADIKHYFQDVDHEILLGIIEKKIKCQKTIWLIKKILGNVVSFRKRGTCQFAKGMPLGNLTSQFFANVYLNELDYLMKHKLKIKYYIRYVDDFVILHESEEQLEGWLDEINSFLISKMKLVLHPQKTKTIRISKGIYFVGFRNFSKKRLLRKRNIRQMKKKLELYRKGEISKSRFLEILEGWLAYAKWAQIQEPPKHF